MSRKLYDLIQAMSKAEKRQFKLHARKQGGAEHASYLQLFDVLARLKKYDESRLASKLGGQLSGTRLSSLKNYLYKLLLDSLRFEGNAAGRKDSLLRAMLDIQVLQRKGLYDQSWKLLNKATDLAERSEHFDLLLVLLREQRTTLFRSKQPKTWEEILMRISQREQEAFKKLEQIRSLENLSASSTMLALQIGELRSEEMERSVSQQMDHPQMAAELALSKQARILQLQVTYNIQTLRGDDEGATRSALESIELMDRPDGDIGSRLNYYSFLLISWLDNYSFSSNDPDMGLFTKQLDRLRKLPDTFHPASIPTNVLERVVASYAIEVHFHMRRKERKDLVVALRRAEQLMNDPDQAMGSNTRRIFHTLCGLANFELDRWDIAIDHSRAILEEFGNGTRSDLVNIANCLNLMAHVALGNGRYGLNRAKALARHYRKLPAPHRFEQTLFKTMKDYTTEEDPHTRHKLLDQALIEFEGLENDPAESRMFRYIPIRDWITKFRPVEKVRT